MQLIKLPDESATLALGQHLIAQLSAGSVVALTGGLGAGKTTLVRGMLRAVLGDIEVPSPTFTLVQTYELPDYEIWHCDMYRLERPEDGIRDPLWSRGRDVYKRQPHRRRIYLSVLPHPAPLHVSRKT